MALQKIAPLDLSPFDISAERGFLPRRDPLATLPHRWPAFLNDLAQAIPKLPGPRQLRAYVAALGESWSTGLGNRDRDELRCAARILSFAGHGYVWEDPHQPADRIPASLAVPWYHVMKMLGRPPVLSYASYTLDNWRRLDPTRPIELGNITLLQNFLGGFDAERFVLVHVDIEAKAGKALARITQALIALPDAHPDEVMLCFQTVASAEKQMHHTLRRMPERCDPYIYYNRVRPYIHGWKDNPTLPRGVVYDGVE